MASTSVPAARRLPTDQAGISVGRWGMLLFVLTEALLFGTLISSYFYVRSANTDWPPPGIKAPELKLIAVMTVVLLASSVPMWWAEEGIKRGFQGQLRLGLLVSALMALAFLAMQGYEYSREDFSPTTNVYGSLFFTITGLHGLHVLGAVLINAVAQLRAWLGHFSTRRHLAISNTALYWHFVDGIWVVILLTVYISPHVLKG